MAHWHDHNPWADTCVYLPDIDEAAACINPRNPSEAKRDWRAYGLIDIYILPQPSGYHSFGVRFGAESHQYLSPHINEYLACLLLQKYAPGGGWKTPPKPNTKRLDDLLEY